MLIVIKAQHSAGSSYSLSFFQTWARKPAYPRHGKGKARKSEAWKVVVFFYALMDVTFHDSPRSCTEGIQLLAQVMIAKKVLHLTYEGIINISKLTKITGRD